MREQSPTSPPLPVYQLTQNMTTWWFHVLIKGDISSQSIQFNVFLIKRKDVSSSPCNCKVLQFAFILCLFFGGLLSLDIREGKNNLLFYLKTLKLTAPFIQTDSAQIAADTSIYAVLSWDHFSSLTCALFHFNKQETQSFWVLTRYLDCKTFPTTYL